MGQEQMLEQALAILWQEVTQRHFLREPTTPALVTLERRREIVERLLGLEVAKPPISAGAALLMMDHFHTLLKAESAWLEHALSETQMGAGI